MPISHCWWLNKRKCQPSGLTVMILQNFSQNRNTDPTQNLFWWICASNWAATKDWKGSMFAAVCRSTTKKCWMVVTEVFFKVVDNGQKFLFCLYLLNILNKFLRNCWLMHIFEKREILLSKPLEVQLTWTLSEHQIKKETNETNSCFIQFPIWQKTPKPTIILWWVKYWATTDPSIIFPIQISFKRITPIDTFMNRFWLGVDLPLLLWSFFVFDVLFWWVWCVELLPMWMAPNLITFVGLFLKSFQVSLVPKKKNRNKRKNTSKEKQQWKK